MTDYSKLSDFEINKRVVIALDIDMHFFIPESEDSFGACFSPSELGPIWQTSAYWVGDFKVSNGNKFNPCNNPADAWQIIFENKIMLSPRCADDEWKAEIYLGREDIFDNYASAWHKNPLRAAMIVFLMMQEGD
jgi:hypothetical protein